MKAARIHLLVALVAFGQAATLAGVLNGENARRYVDSFNANDQELYPGYVTNGAAWDFLKDKIPLFDCPDKDIEETYYFRWWTYRKHIKQTRGGFIITEFLPDVPWAGKDDSIDCAAGHHFYEGRWLADPKYLDDYAVFWFRKGGDARQYSFWAADALWARYLVTGDEKWMVGFLPDLVRNYEGWEKSNLGTNGLFWQEDGKDGMEMSAGGSGYRPTINSYMYGDAVAIAKIASLANEAEVERTFHDKAAALQKRIEAALWNPKDEFFETRSREKDQLVSVRELCGYTPWYFNLPDADRSVAWKQLMDAKGFCATFGPTTTEQRSPGFAVAYSGHECQWNGPSWPYSTAVTLTAMANLLDNYSQKAVSRDDYFDLLRIYTKSQRLKRDDGRVVPWIDEVLDPYNGTWIARTLLKQRGWEIPERGKDYNHSTYCDLIISGLIGLRPRADEAVEVEPLVPRGVWDYFCLDNVHYHGRVLTILYDKTGRRYGKGKGMRLLRDGREIAANADLGKLRAGDR